MRQARFVLVLAPFVLHTAVAQTPRFASATQPGGIPDLGGSTSQIAVADVDGDGDLDAVLARQVGGSIAELVLLHNDGRGAFSEAPAGLLPPAPPSLVYALHFFDADGDGDADLLVGATGDRLFLNDGTGNFSDVTVAQLPTSLDPTGDFATGDVDGDGDADIVAASFSPNPIPFGFQGRQNRLYLNNGSGTFSDVTASHMPVHLDHTFAVVLFNADQDPEPELYFSNTSTDQFDPATAQDRLYDNNGSGVFVEITATNLPADTDGAFDAAALDVDFDGDQDLVRIGQLAGHAALLRNDGSGGFTDVTATAAPTLEVGNRLDVGDLNSDGIPDVFVARGLQNGLYVADAFGGLVDASDTLPPDVDASACVVVADFDGNGTADVATGATRTSSQNWSRDRVYFQRQGGTFDLAPRYEIGASNLMAQAMASGDVDGDGDVDILIGDRFNPNELYYGDGDGGFTRATPAQFPVLPGRTQDVAFGDVDGDGDLDAWIGNGSNISTQDHLLLNDGAGNFTDATATNIPASNDRAFGIDFGDVDGDGDLDMVTGLGEHSPTPNRLLRNNGAGVFTFDNSAIPGLAGRTRDVVLVDIDGDTDLDLVWADFEANRILVNDGTGNFTDETATRYPSVSFATGFHVRAADVDNDGDQDLLFAGHAGLPSNRLFLNDGSGFFSDVTGTNLPANNLVTTVAELADMDNDGDVDIVLGYEGAALYLNDGSGIFVDATATVVDDLDPTHSLVLADVDLDTDLDIVVGRYMRIGFVLDKGRHLVLRNHLRQWDASDFPLRGFDYHVELTAFGTSGLLAAPFLDFVGQSPRIPVFDLGVLGLPPATMIGFPGLSTDANGRATWALPILNVPQALGLTLYTQTIVVPSGDPATWRFTNRAVDPIR